MLPYFNVPVYQFFTDTDFDTRLAEEESEVQRALDEQHSVRRSPSVHLFPTKVVILQKPVPASPRHFYAICGARDADNEESLSSFRALSGVIFKKRLQLRSTKCASRRSSKVGSVSMFFWVLYLYLFFILLQERQRSRRHDMLDPYVHQRIAVLFGSFSPKSPNAPYFCVRPWVVNMEFYGPHDMTLGEFLTKYANIFGISVVNMSSFLQIYARAQELINALRRMFELAGSASTSPTSVLLQTARFLCLITRGSS